jgi:endonuclease/exonuclease/phosphatase family metal-dependent hydrolase
MTHKYKHKINITKKYKGGEPFTRLVVKKSETQGIQQKRLEQERVEKERIEKERLEKLKILLEHKEKIKKSQIDVLSWNIQWERMSANKTEFKHECMSGKTNNCLNNVAHYINLFQNLDIICLQEVENWDKIHTIIKKDNMKYVHTTHTIISGNEVQLVTLYNTKKFKLLAITYDFIHTHKRGRHYHILYFKDNNNNLFIIINLHNGHYAINGNKIIPNSDYTKEKLESKLYTNNVLWNIDNIESSNNHIKIKINEGDIDLIIYEDKDKIISSKITPTDIRINKEIYKYFQDTQKNMIVVGDFNDPLYSFVETPFYPLKNSEVLKDLFVSQKNSTIPITCCNDISHRAVRIPGDYILISNNLEYQGEKEGNKIIGMIVPKIQSGKPQIPNKSIDPKTSDHLPVYSNILLPPPIVPLSLPKPLPKPPGPPPGLTPAPPPVPPSSVSQSAPKPEPKPAPPAAPKPEPLAEKNPIPSAAPNPEPKPAPPASVIPASALLTAPKTVTPASALLTAPKAVTPDALKSVAPAAPPVLKPDIIPSTISGIKSVPKPPQNVSNPAPITQKQKPSFLNRLSKAVTRRLPSFFKKTSPSPGPNIQIKNDETELKESINNLLTKLDIPVIKLSDNYYDTILTNINRILPTNATSNADPELELKEKISNLLRVHYNIELNKDNEDFYNKLAAI